MPQLQKLNELVNKPVIVNSNAGMVKGVLQKVITSKQQCFRVEKDSTMIEFAFYDTKAVQGNIINLK